jgi:hypothetical protein
MVLKLAAGIALIGLSICLFVISSCLRKKT